MKAMDSEKQTEYLIACLAPKRGEAILDLGCGTGRELERILRLGTAGMVVGIDTSPKQLGVAAKRLRRYVAKGKAQLLIGDAGKQLPFPSRSFHAVYSAELMECIPEAKRRHLLREIHRVLKPGGRVLTEHTDWDTQVWNAIDRTLERRLVHAFCDWTQGWMESSDGWMGRRLPALFRRSALFKNVEVSAYVLTNDRYEPGFFGYERSQDFRALAKKAK
ncbi:MAG: methyltransferase domain-containing protein, partial [Candidatus Eisenbacteria bacterium]